MITDYDFSYRLKAGAFLAFVAGTSAIGSFAVTLSSCKKKEPDIFQPDIHNRFPNDGIKLAVRALKWGTFYSVIGTSCIAFGIWKLSGANNMQEFREKMGQLLPKVPKNNPPIGRTEFTGLSDFLKYVSEDYSKDVSKEKQNKS